MKNKGLIITIVVLVIMVISAICITVFFNDDYSDVNVNVIDIMNDISSNLESELSPMTDLDDSNVSENYNFDLSKVEAYAIKIPLMNIRADEIAIIKVNNKRDIEYIKNILMQRLKTIENTFDEYLQDQYELAKNPLIIIKGRYILMAVSDKNEDIENIFNSYFKSEIKK